MIQIGNYNFDGPWSLSRTDLIDRAAVYVILCSRSDGKYDVVYVGETGQVGTRLSNHERATCWNRNCSGSLYVAIFWTPSDRYSADDRRAIEKKLRDQYNPPCNRQ
jgi:predicted GIY-YIG superfamily endonuclease